MEIRKWQWRMEKGKRSHSAGFTLTELLISISIFAVVSTVVASLYIQSFRESKKTNLQNQIYEDARFILKKIADEARAGMVDYDEYYNQNVAIKTKELRQQTGGNVRPLSNLLNYGQNYGRYYSSFFNPGADQALGFDCNDALRGGTLYIRPERQRDEKRSLKECTPLRKTLDRNTGVNPFDGKLARPSADQEDAFCGVVAHDTVAQVPNLPQPRPNVGLCAANGDPDPARERIQEELYLISADAWQKTIVAREKIGGTDLAPVYALSILRFKGLDTDADTVPDAFVCADGFQCRSTDQPNIPNLNDRADAQGDIHCRQGSADLPAKGHLPRSRDKSLKKRRANDPGHDQCDSADAGFTKDFVPISSSRINITSLIFFITPHENPYYAFAETNQLIQPRVKIVLTVEANPEVIADVEMLRPVTLTATVSSNVKTSVPAPLFVMPKP